MWDEISRDRSWKEGEERALGLAFQGQFTCDGQYEERCQPQLVH